MDPLGFRLKMTERSRLASFKCSLLLLHALERGPEPLVPRLRFLRQLCTVSCQFRGLEVVCGCQKFLALAQRAEDLSPSTVYRGRDQARLQVVFACGLHLGGHRGELTDSHGKPIRTTQEKDVLERADLDHPVCEHAQRRNLTVEGRGSRSECGGLAEIFDKVPFHHEQQIRV